MSDRAIAVAQIVISIVFLIGYFWLLGQFVTGQARVDPEYKDIVNSLLSVLTAGVAAIVYFWFQRTRAAPTLADDPQWRRHMDSLAPKMPPAPNPYEDYTRANEEKTP